MDVAFLLAGAGVLCMGAARVIDAVREWRVARTYGWARR